LHQVVACLAPYISTLHDLLAVGLVIAALGNADPPLRRFGRRVLVDWAAGAQKNRASDSNGTDHSMVEYHLNCIHNRHPDADVNNG